VVDVVDALTKALAEAQLSDELLEASRQLQTEESISRHVCARLIYRTGATVRESTWTDDGYVEQDQLIVDVPPGITSFSPDFTRLAIETPWNDSGGGPIYLFNMETSRLFNLNQALSLHDYGGPLGLTISGWHPLGDRLLLVDEDDNIVVWTDVTRENQRRIALNPDPNQFTPIRQIELAPDGNSFIYVVDGPNNKTTVNQYHLATQESHTLATLPVERGRLRSFRFSPVGEVAAYVQSKGERTSGRSYAMELFNLESYTVTTLIEGNLGQTEPVWSPDGQKIAFVRKTVDEPDISGPDQGQLWQGNIWVAFLDLGELRQITFVEGAAQRPVWSPDSRRLAFITSDNELGLVEIDQPGVIWRLGAAITRPQFTAIAFVP
jgi:WD40 repeat protein